MKELPELSGVPNIRKEDYAFTVEAKGSLWDVYYFVKDGKDGTLAFRKRGPIFEIGVFKAGKLTEAEVFDEITSLTAQ